MRYNDKSVLENHHIAASFALLKREELNIFETLERAELKEMREKMIALVLSTDMAFHFSDQAKLKGRLNSEDFDPTKDKDKLLCMTSIIHMADISNPSKEFDLCRKWTELLFEEFFG